MLSFYCIHFTESALCWDNVTILKHSFSMSLRAQIFKMYRRAGVNRLEVSRFVKIMRRIEK